LYALFLSHNSIHNFRNKETTTKSCIPSFPEVDMLREHVKLLAQKQNRHPNSVWAEFKRKYGFHSYKNIDCQTLENIKRDIYIKTRYIQKENIQ